MGAIGCQQGLALPCLANRVATEGKRSDFLVATSLDQLLFLNKNVIYLFYKTSYLKEEVCCTEPYPDQGDTEKHW
jgi:hypothetical protein